MSSDKMNKYYYFTSKSRLDKAINSLLGIIEGTSIDSCINDKEQELILLWLSENKEYCNKHPFNELVPVVEEAMNDRILASEERENIAWLCEKFKSTAFFGNVVADLQRLHAILGGILFDGVISEEEANGLAEWLQNHEHLRKCWPYDEVESLLASVLSDGKIDSEEQRMLQSFFSEFVVFYDDRTITQPVFLEGSTLKEVCAINPDIQFENSLFCFTGTSNRFNRNELEKRVVDRGGKTTKTVNEELDYLVVGSAGNPCWAFATYGRKIEKVISLRKKGFKAQIIHENDFHDAG